MENDAEFEVRDPREVPAPCRIGEILIQAGKISAAGAENVAEMQKKENVLFGEAAIKMGLLTREDISLALDIQFSCRRLDPHAQEAVSAEVIAAHRPSDALTEVFRSIRGHLIRSGAGRQIKTLSIISPDEGEGKTFIAANMAASFAQIGCETLLADLNFRTPRIHKLFRLKNNCGASSILIRRAEAGDAVRESAIKSLHVLPSGPVPPNPGDLMGSDGTRQLLSSLREAYDVVIVDTPPYFSASDAITAASLTDGMLLVASRGHTTMAALGTVKKGLEGSGGRVLGVLINDPPLPPRGAGIMKLRRARIMESHSQGTMKSLMKSLMKSWGARPWGPR